MSTWNLNTLRMYENDLWSTLSLSTKKTRTIQYILSIKSQIRYKRKRLEKRKVQTKNVKLMLSRLKITNKYRKYPRLHSKRLMISSIDKKTRRAFRLKRNRVFKRKSLGKRYLISYVKTRRRRNVFVRVKKRRFLSQNLINFRKFKRFYSTLTNRQFSIVMREARLKKENNFESLIKTLESRLDILLFRSNLVTSLFMARHFLNHRHIQINGKQAYADSKIKLYDNVSFKYRSLNMHRNIVQRNALMHYRVSLIRSKRIVLLFLPSYLEVDFKALSFNLIAGILNKNVYYPFLVDRASIENFLFRA
jgi:small subunit ribosomal protein S4